MNPYANKVIVNGQAIIDLTEDTVTPESLLDGFTAHDKSGAPIIGTAQSGGDYAALIKEIAVSAHSAGTTAVDVLLASKSEMVAAGILKRTSQKITDLWSQYSIRLDFVAGQAHEVYSLVSSWACSPAPSYGANGTLSYFRGNFSHPSSTLTSLTAANNIRSIDNPNSSDYGLIFEDADGLEYRERSSFKLMTGTYVLRVFVSRKF